MDNVCSLNTVYRDCSSGAAFSYCSEDRWGFQKHPLEQQSWGFGSRWVSGVFISVYSVYTLSLVEKEPYLAADRSVRKLLWGWAAAAVEPRLPSAAGPLRVRWQQPASRGSSEKAARCSRSQTKQQRDLQSLSLPMNSALSKHLHSLTLSLRVKNSVSSSTIFSCSLLWNTSPVLIIAVFRDRQTKGFLKFE